eukprot:427644-Pyramimonas_sp.AAC.1
MATILENLGRHRERQNGKQQTEMYLAACKELVNSAPQKASEVLTRLEPTFSSIQRIIRTIDEQSDGTLTNIVKLVTKVAKRSQGRALFKSLEKFKEWVESPQALGALHRSIKDAPL